MGDGRLYAWNAESGELVYSNQFTPRLLGGCPVADHKRLVLVEDNGGAGYLYDLQTHQTELIEEHMPKQPVAWKASLDGRLVCYVTTNDQVKVYDATSKRTRFIAKLADPPIDIVAAEFSPDSRWLAVGSSGGQIQVWNVGTGRPVGNPLPRYSADTWKFSFSADGKSLVTYAMDNTARIWNIATSREMVSGLRLNWFLNDHTQWTILPPDGNSVLEGAGEQAIHVVRLPTLAEIDRPQAPR